MVITGDRVKCANCGMVYNKPPVEKVFWIGVPFTVVGVEFCPNCGSNSADAIEQPVKIFTTDRTNLLEEEPK